MPSNLDVSTVQVDPNSYAVSGHVSVDVGNQGAGASSIRATVTVFEDRNGNRLVDESDAVFASFGVGPIAAGQSGRLELPVRGTVRFPGSPLAVWVDRENVIAEADETNNFVDGIPSCKIIAPELGFEAKTRWSWPPAGQTESEPLVMMAPAVGDLDGDGIPDVAFVSYAGNYHGTGHLRVFDGKTGAPKFTASTPVFAISALALGDIDRDGRPDIVAAAADGNHLVAFENDGTLKWTSQAVPGATEGGYGTVAYSAISLADLDHDGRAEIIVGSSVVDCYGKLRWSGSGGSALQEGGRVSAVADLDMDGTPEIVAGRTAYRADGSVYWSVTSLADGYVGVGNLDDDPYPEVVLVGGNVSLLDHDGTVKWTVPLVGGGLGGAPTIADVDGDGRREIGVAGAGAYVVYRTTGVVLWSAPTTDLSSNITGSTVFDFDGDGKAEIVYGDELYLRVYRGNNGEVLWQTPAASATIIEEPLVVDVDGDSHAEIVVTSTGPEFGIRVLGASKGDWMNSRHVWNQHGYHITNVNDDLSIPVYEAPSWEVTNTYRLNTVPDSCVAARPDLVASRLSVAGDVSGRSASVRIGNAGNLAVQPGAAVSFYAGDPRVEGVLLATAHTSSLLNPGMHEDVQAFLATGEGTIWAVADDRGGLRGELVELDESNNFDRQPETNRAPVVAVPSNVVSESGVSLRIEGVVTDDGLPVNSLLAIAWTKVSGPGALVFGDPDQRVTTLTASAVGDYVLRLTASDGQFQAWAETTFTVVAAGSNAAPLVVMTGDQQVRLPAHQASLSALVSDDGLPTGSTVSLQWMQVSGPAEALLATPNAASTEVTLPETTGTYVFLLTASDGEQLSTGTTRVSLTPPEGANRAPVVSAGPNLIVTAPATDVALAGTMSDDGLPLGVVPGVVWNQLSGPSLVSFASLNMATTTANFPGPGDYELELLASDGEYLSSSSVVVKVVEPVINRAPTAAIAGPAFVPWPQGTGTFTGIVQDDGLPADGAVQVAWSMVSGPGTAAFSTGAQSATGATFSAPGTYVLQFEATDGALSGFARITVKVAPINTAPVVSAGGNWALAYPTRTVALMGTASDDGLPDGSTLSTQWRVMSGPGEVVIASASAPETGVTFSYPGTYVLRLSASDGELTSESTVTIAVAAAPGAAPTVSLTDPSDGATVTAPTSVTGTVSGGEWKLEYRRGGEDGDGDWVTFALGSGAVAAGELGRLDPTMMLNGLYAIRLTSTSSGGEASALIEVSVEKNLKIGNFSVSFSDLNVPVAGLPIEVIRTYDRRDKAAGDFGVGWNVSLRNIRVETSGMMGKNWAQERQPGTWPTYCMRQTRPRFVTLTFPTGKVYRFHAFTEPECESLTTIGVVNMGFEAEAGTRATLTAGAGEGLIVTERTLLDTDGRVFDPSLFQLTTPDGMVYAVAKQQGLQWMRDRNGTSVTVSRAGIIHSSGKGVTFERDGDGRIVKMTDPAGESLGYEYMDGLLVTVIDREGNRTSFTYDDERKLRDIVDPRGKRAIRNEYGDDGRLVRTIDADGKTIEYTHRLADNQEVITDRTGAQRMLTYDNRGNVLRETDQDGRSATREFDENDNRTIETVKVSDTLSVTSKWKYDASDNLIEAEDGRGKKTTYTYNAWNQVLTTTDPLRRKTTNTYDPNTGNLLTTRDALEHAAVFVYDRYGNPISWTDRLGRRTGYTHDSSGNLVSEEDPAGNRTTYTHDANGNRLSESRTRTKADDTVETLTTRYTYDKNGRVLSITHPDGSTTSTTYTEAGQRATSTDALGRVTKYTYDDLGRLLRTLYPDRTSTSSTYDEEGRVVSSTDRGGRVTKMEYDRAGHLVKTTYPDLSFTSTEYYLNGWVKSTTDAGGHVTRYEYDEAGRKTKVIDAAGQETTFTYDDAGNQLTVIDGRQNTTTSVYDALNRLVTTQFADNTQRSTTYDDEGQRSIEIDQAGETTNFGYDRLGRLTSVTDALNQTTRYGYDELGNRTSIVDAAGRTTEFAYDRLGRETKRILPDGKFELKTYNVAGELVAKTDFQGRTTTYTYDEAGRLTQKKYPDESKISFTYTKNGRRATAVDARGTTKYTYDERDRLTTLEYPSGQRLEYGYDGEGRRTSLTARVGTTSLATGYAYDSLDRIASVTDPGNRVFSLEYDEVGSLAELVRPNGADTKYTHDRLNRLTGIRTYTRASDTTIASYAYTLGPTGVRTKIAEADGTERSYEYDALYRLTRETVSGPQSYENSFTYDAVSNRKTQTTTRAGGDGSVDAAAGDVDAGMSGAKTISYSYDNRDRLTSEDQTVYSWSENGNLVGGRTGDGVLAWDFDDRLVKVTKPDGTVVQNTYDVDGVLVRTVVTPSGGTAQVTELLVDTSGGLSHVVAEIDGSGAVTAFYVRAGDMLLEEIRGGVVKMYEADGLGSTRSLLDAVGARTDTWSFDAFGTTVSTTGGDVNPYRFAGERFVDSVGLYQNRARWLDTRTGRFVSVDPAKGNLRLPISVQPYLYGNDSPASYADPTGRMSEGMIGVMVVTAHIAIIGSLAYASLNNYANTARGGIRKETLAEMSKYREIRIAWGDPPGSVDFDMGVANLIRYWWKTVEEHDIEEAHYTAATFRNISYGVSQDIRICAAERYITGLIQARNWVVKDGYWPGQTALYNAVKRTVGPSYVPPFGFYPPSPYSANASNWYDEGRSGFGGQAGIVPQVRCWNFYDYAHDRYWSFDQGPGFAPVACQ